MLYNSLREKLPVLATQPTHDFLCFLLTHPVLHSSTTSTPPSNHPSPAPPFPKKKKPRCPVERHVLVFHWLSSCQGWEACVWGALAVKECLVGCHSASLARRCSQSFPEQRGQPTPTPLLPPPHIWLSGAPDSSDHRPNLSSLECEFSDLRLQIVHLQQRQSRNAISVGNIFPPQLSLSVL